MSYAYETKLNSSYFYAVFYVSGLCQDTNPDISNAIFGNVRFNSASPAISISYERVFLQNGSIDFGGYLSVNATHYREYYRQNYIKPSLSVGIIISEILNNKNKIGAMLGGDFFPFQPSGIYFHGKLAYEYYLPKPKLGLRFFVSGNVDLDYSTYIENPSLTRKQISKTN